MESLEELKRQKLEIEMLLESLENDYREGLVSEESYKEIKEKNEERLAEIERKMDELSKEKEDKEKRLRIPLITKREEEKPEFVKREELDERLKSLQKSVTEAVMKVEKIEASLEALKEGKKASDERLQGLAESVGEIRSMLFEREAKLKEQEVRLEKVFTLMEELKPESILKAMSKRDQKLSEHEMKFEKLEMLTSEISKELRRVKETLKAIGNLENLVEVDKRIAERLSAMEERAKGVERIASKIEKLFLELNRKLEEFETYRIAQERMEESLNETMKTLSDMSMKLEEYARREELNTLRELVEALQDEVQKLRRVGAEQRMPPEVEELEKEKESIQALLESLEEQYRARSISEEEYLKIKETNLKRIEKIEEKIRELISSSQKAEGKVETEEKPKVTEERPKTKEGQDRLVSELEDLLKLGLISKDAYERTKRLLKTA